MDSLKIVVVVLCLFATGCTSVPQDQPPTNHPPIVHEGTPNIPTGTNGNVVLTETYNFTGSVLVGVGDPNVTYVTNGTHLFFFPVKHGARAIVAFLSWQDTVADLDLFVKSPSCEKGGVCLSNTDGAIAHPDSPVEIVYSNNTIEVGNNWSYQVWSKLAVNIPFHGNVTIFYS